MSGLDGACLKSIRDVSQLTKQFSSHIATERSSQRLEGAANISSNMPSVFTKHHFLSRYWEMMQKLHFIYFPRASLSPLINNIASTAYTIINIDIILQ